MTQWFGLLRDRNTIRIANKSRFFGDPRADPRNGRKYVHSFVSYNLNTNERTNERTNVTDRIDRLTDRILRRRNYMASTSNGDRATPNTLIQWSVSLSTPWVWNTLLTVTNSVQLMSNIAHVITAHVIAYNTVHKVYCISSSAYGWQLDDNNDSSNMTIISLAIAIPSSNAKLIRSKLRIWK